MTRLDLSHMTYSRIESSVHPKYPSALGRVLKNGFSGNEKMGIASPDFTVDHTDDFAHPSGFSHELRPEIKSLITHLRTHSMYFPAFESPFLDMTSAYYMDESARLMKALKSDPAKFMKRCFERVKQEVDRAKEMFIEDSWEKVRGACEMALFDQSHSWVARDGTFYQSIALVLLTPAPLALPRFMDDEDLERLGEVYTTFTRVRCADEVLGSFKHYVQVGQTVASTIISGTDHRD